MADETLESITATGNIIRGGSEHLRDSDVEIVTLSEDALVGLALTSTGVVDPNVAIMASGNIFRGILLGPVIRPSDNWSPNDTLLSGTQVYMLKPTGGRLLILMLLCGQSVITANLAGAIVTNVKDAGATNATPSDGGVYADPTPIAGTEIIGKLAGDVTHAAVDGSWELVWY